MSSVLITGVGSTKTVQHSIKNISRNIKDVSKTTFEYTVLRIEDEIGRKDTSMHKAVFPKRTSKVLAQHGKSFTLSILPDLG